VLERYGIDRGLEICKESGFDAIDFGFGSYTLKEGIYTASDDEFESHFAAIKKKADDLELIISQTHGRTGTYWLGDEQHNADVDRYCELDLRASSILGSPSCVIHFINNTRWGKQTPEFLHQTSGEMFDKMIPFAEKYKVNIALETFGAAKVQGARIRDFFADPVEFRRQFDSLDTQYKTICVDSGHTHEVESFWVPSPGEMIRILGKDVTILEMQGKIAPDAWFTYHWAMDIELSERENLHTITNGRCTGIEAGKVTYLDADGKEQTLEADSVVLCVGFRARTAQAESLVLPGVPFTMIGDCKKVGTVQQAVRSAFDAAMIL
jgi:sugar phosphate isomerase/epimerase